MRPSLRPPRIPALAWILALPLLAACAGPHATRPESPTPYRPASTLPRATARAEALTRQAAGHMDSDPARAEQLLLEALALDLFFGPAHNNLGVLLLARNDLYGAASEFEWARKLMPGHPDPHVNLAITLERAGRDSEALASYSAALETYPGHLPAIQGLARATLLGRSEDPRLDHWLEEIVTRGTTQEWRNWAVAQRARRRP